MKITHFVAEDWGSTEIRVRLHGPGAVLVGPSTKWIRVIGPDSRFPPPPPERGSEEDIHRWITTLNQGAFDAQMLDEPPPEL